MSRYSGEGYERMSWVRLFAWIWGAYRTPGEVKYWLQGAAKEQAMHKHFGWRHKCIMSECHEQEAA